MRRIWPLALVFVPALAALLRTDPRPRTLASPVPEEILEISLPEPPTPMIPKPHAAPAAVAATEAPVEREFSWRDSVILRSLVWLAHHQNEDGSWGDVPVSLKGHVLGKAGTTSLAILSFLGYGYSHLSRDEHDGQVFGLQVDRALLWMIADQREDGTFRSIQDAGFDQALATLALHEAYGMTEAPAFKEPALKSIEALGRMQGSDGGWGGPEPSAWAIMAVHSADLSEFKLAPGLKARALRYTEATDHPSQLWNRQVLSRSREGLDLLAAGLMASPPHPQDIAAWLHATGSIYRYDGPNGDLWKSFAESMKQAMIPRQHESGTWPGDSGSYTVVRTSLAMLTLEVLWNHRPSTFGPPP